MPTNVVTNPPQTPAIVKFSYENAGTQNLQAGFSSLGHVFSAGELAAGQAMTALVNGQSVPVQVDVKTTYADGSAKMAVLTLARPALAPGAIVEARLTPTAAPQAPDLDLASSLASHSFAVTLTAANGAVTQIDVLAALRDALANGTASVWQDGPLAAQARVEIQLPGSQRMVFDVTTFASGGMAVEAQFNNDDAMQAIGGRVAYQAAVTIDGRLAAQASLNQGQYQNWHQSFSSDGRDGGQGLGAPNSGWLNIRHDVAQLQEAGAVARYDLGLDVDPALLNKWAAATAAPGWNAPLAVNGVVQYMPTSGGREDIGITTTANTAWLISQDARAAAYAMGQAETASAIPWHAWDAQNNTWLGTDAYPALWIDYRGGPGIPGNPTSTGLTQKVDDASGWSVDQAHQPDLSYVPYLLTGERWMLDNLQAQASWSLMSTWPYPRGNADDIVVLEVQLRAAAWSLRQIDEAAWISPEGSPEKAAFAEASAANWAWLVAQIPRWTQEQGEAYGWVPGAYGNGVQAPWQQDYFASTAIAAASRGNADAATFLEWQTNFLIGRFTHAADGFNLRDGAAYNIAVGDPVTGISYQTWAEIGAATVARGYSNGTGWAQSQGNYAQLALATLAAIANLPGSPQAAAAAAAYDALIAQAPPFTATSNYARDPGLAMARPGADQGTAVDDPTEGPAPPVDEAASVALSIVLGADSWLGDPEALVLVNGVMAFRGVISAKHDTGGVEVDLGDVAAGVDHMVTVHFLNDAWGGTTATDRNLYVEEILIDGQAVGRQASLLRTGEVSFELPGVLNPPLSAATPPALAPVEPPPAGAGTLHDPADASSVGTHEAAPPDAVAAGAIDADDLPAPVPAAPVLAAPVPAAPQGPPVRAASGDPAAVSLSRDDATQSPPAQAAASIGTGGDTLRIGLSADAWDGDPLFTVMVDQQQIGGVQTATARHLVGETSLLDVRGDFEPGEHVLAIRFLNDAWGGESYKDRNLYVVSLAANGIDLDQDAALLDAGEALFRFVLSEDIFRA